MKTFDELFDTKNLTFNVPLGKLTAIEKDVVVNGIFGLLRETRSKLLALTKKVAGKDLDFTIITQPDFQITYFDMNLNDSFDNDQYVYIEGYMNHKKVESRRWKTKDVEAAASEIPDEQIEKDIIRSRELEESLDVEANCELVNSMENAESI